MGIDAGRSPTTSQVTPASAGVAYGELGGLRLHYGMLFEGLLCRR